MLNQKDLPPGVTDSEKEEAPYRYGADYTGDEVARLREFMRADFPHVAYGGARQGETIVEYPPAEICPPEQWKEILDTVLVPELDEFHPLLRQGKKVIRFVQKLYDPKEDIESGGNLATYGKGKRSEKWVRIPLKWSDGSARDRQVLIFTLMHELIEKDFWMKTHKNDLEAPSDQETEITFKSGDDDSYRNLLDEKIANRRAVRALQRMWPGFNFADPKKIYEEDKED